MALVAALTSMAGLIAAQSAAPARTSLVIVVHPSNPVTDLTLDEVRSIFMLDRQFWPGGRRIAVLLPPIGSSERAVLLQTVYGLSDSELRKSWVARLFQGDIPAVPAVLRANASAIDEVLRCTECVTVVDSRRNLESAHSITVNHRRPDEEGYPLAIDTEATDPRSNVPSPSAHP